MMKRLLDYGSNQLWYFDFRQDSQHPMIVSARSGKCLDIPNADPSFALQMSSCHGGSNQKVAQYLHNPQGSGLAYVSGVTGGFAYPISSSLTSLSVRGGPTTANSVATEFRACQTGTTGNTDQRWFMTYRLDLSAPDI